MAPTGDPAGLFRFVAFARWRLARITPKMTRALRTYLALMLSLMLAFTGHSMAVARGMPGPEGHMVICTGEGLVMVYVDEDGIPVSPPHLCPEGAVSLIQSGCDAPIALAHPELVQRIRFVAQHAVWSGVAQRISNARDPPGAT